MIASFLVCQASDYGNDYPKIGGRYVDISLFASLLLTVNSYLNLSGPQGARLNRPQIVLELKLGSLSGHRREQLTQKVLRVRLEGHKQFFFLNRFGSSQQGQHRFTHKLVRFQIGSPPK